MGEVAGRGETIGRSGRNTQKNATNDGAKFALWAGLRNFTRQNKHSFALLRKLGQPALPGAQDRPGPVEPSAQTSYGPTTLRPDAVVGSAEESMLENARVASG